MKKRLLVMVMVLALAVSFTVAVLASPSSDGTIEFIDDRDGSIIIDPGPPGSGDCNYPDPGCDCPICNWLPPVCGGDWWDLDEDGEGLDFWTHDLADIEAVTTSMITFHTIRADNGAWDPDAGSGEESSTTVYFDSQGGNNQIQVSMTGFHVGTQHVLLGHSLDLVRGDYMENTAGTVSGNFHPTITLTAGAGGAEGTAASITSAWLGGSIQLGIQYTGELEVSRAQALATGANQAQAEIIWSVVSGP
jgi:hypothetical protein